MAGPTKGKVTGSLTPKVVVPLEELQAIQATEPTGSALTASPADLTGGAAGQAVQQQYDVAKQAPIIAAQKTEDDATGTVWSAGFQEGTTAWMGEAFERSWAENYRDYDPDFNAASSAVQMFRDAGMVPTEHQLELLGRTATLEDQVYQFERIRQHAENEELLSRHGAVAFATAVLDPAQLIADSATYGTTRAFKMGRLASAVTGAVGINAPTLGADLAGRETEDFQYVLNAALGGGAMALFGGAGLGRGPNSWLGQPRGLRAVNSFLSETDKLAVNDEAVDVLKNLVDDPVRRPGLLVNDNAASIFRRYDLEMQGGMQEYDDLVEATLRTQQDFNWLSRKMDWSGKYTDAKDMLNQRVAQELLRRDAEWTRYGSITTSNRMDPVIQKLADISDKVHGRMGQIAKEAGVRGFEDFTPRPGYFHRSWNGSKMVALEESEKGLVRRLLSESAMRGIAGVTNDEADAIAGALIQRAKDKLVNSKSDFLGTLGKADTTVIREMLEASKLTEARITSIMGKIEAKASEQGTIKYGKHRLTLDMDTSIVAKNGSTIRMIDLIDNDLDRVMQNYLHAMSGRSALAKAGIGSDEAEIQAFRRKYESTTRSLPAAEQADLSRQLEELLGDFTGNRPGDMLSPLGQRARALAESTMLGGSGVLQVGDYATIAYRHGVFETGKQFLKSFPGVRQTLERIHGSPDLSDEMRTVLNLDLGADVRFRPWKKQADAFLSARDTALDRILHSGRQAVPFLNGMKYIHANQSRMNINLTLNKFARAAKGDAEALEQIKKYAPDMDWSRVEQELLTKVTYGGKNATAMNWAAWDKATMDSMLNAALRIMDDSLLYGRHGQGTPWARTPVGQVLGQFRSFVSLAHNKIMRGTLNADGPKGLATLMAFQYPMTFLAAGLNEARKGKLELDENGMKEIATKAVGYLPSLGFFSDVANGILNPTAGSRGLSAPVLGLTQAPFRFAGGVTKLIKEDGDAHQGVSDMVGAAMQVTPYLNAMPGTAIALEAFKGE